MTDAALVAKKLAQIETYVAELRRLGQPSRLGHDVREERFIEHTLQLAIQSAIDVASHLVSDARLGEPQTNRELFTLLEQRQYFGADLARDLKNMAGFRNVLVHGYDVVNLSIVRDIVEHHLDDLLSFVAAVRRHHPDVTWSE